MFKKKSLARDASLDGSGTLMPGATVRYLPLPPRFMPPMFVPPPSQPHSWRLISLQASLHPPPSATVFRGSSHGRDYPFPSLHALRDIRPYGIIHMFNWWGDWWLPGRACCLSAHARCGGAEGHYRHQRPWPEGAGTGSRCHEHIIQGGGTYSFDDVIRGCALTLVH